MQEVQNIIRVLEETIKAVKEENVVKIKELSNQTTHTASISQDPDNIAVAVIIYSIGKIIERGIDGSVKKCDSSCFQISSYLEKIIEALKKNDEQKVREYLSLIRKKIYKLSDKYKQYIKDVFEKASINKASKIYEHGVSMERTASLLGITMFDLASYAGSRGVGEVPEMKGINVRTRIKLAMEMFE